LVLFVYVLCFVCCVGGLCVVVGVFCFLVFVFVCGCVVFWLFFFLGGEDQKGWCLYLLVCSRFLF